MNKRAIYHAWLNSGFTAREATELTYGRPDMPSFNAEGVYNSKTGRAARVNRQRWIRGLLDNGWTMDEIMAVVEDYYARDSKRSPWDFIRAEYQPPVKKDYREAARRRAEGRTQELYQLYR